MVTYFDHFRPENANTKPMIKTATLMIRGTQLAELTAISSPRKLKLSD